MVTPFDSLKAVAQSMYPWLPIGPFFDHEIDTASAIAAVQTPVAIIAAERDEIVPAERTAALRGHVSATWCSTGQSPAPGTTTSMPGRIFTPRCARRSPRSAARRRLIAGAGRVVLRDGMRVLVVNPGLLAGVDGCPTLPSGLKADPGAVAELPGVEWIVLAAIDRVGRYGRRATKCSSARIAEWTASRDWPAGAIATAVAAKNVIRIFMKMLLD